MNTLIFTRELEAAEAQLRKLAAAGVDALIVQDLGLAKLARELAPERGTPCLHPDDDHLARGPGVHRSAFSAGPRHARPRTLRAGNRQVSHAASATPLEVFVHGALCVAYSGQCLTSESLGQRSANRGECAQACRMPYEIVVDGETRDLGEVRYLLSPQDLAAVDLIPDLRAGGRESRSKSKAGSSRPNTSRRSPAFIARRSTRRWPQAESPVTPADRYALEMTFSRGLTTGWLAGTNHPYLTHGRFGKKRGPLLGEIAACGPGWIELANTTGVPIAAGDGVVFDAG